jgi:hypothetical protein
VITNGEGTHRLEALREVHRIVERRDGAVYRTEYVEDRWVDLDCPRQVGDLIFAAMRTSYEGRTNRAVRIEE